MTTLARRKNQKIEILVMGFIHQFLVRPMLMAGLFLIHLVCAVVMMSWSLIRLAFSQPKIVQQLAPDEQPVEFSPRDRFAGFPSVR